MKKYSSLLVCVLVSFGVWIAHNLSQTYSDVVSMQVIARSNMDAHSQLSTSPVTIAARCRATGFQLLSLGRKGRKPVVVNIEPDSFVHAEGNEFALKPSELYRYSAAIFGDHTTVENLLTQEMVFRFAQENSRKVPVVPVRTIVCRPQYMQVGDVRMQPDSVFIYGDPQLIGGIDRVLTKPVSLNDIHSDTDGSVKLEKIHGVRFSATEARYFINVNRYIELRTELPVKVRNLPSDRRLGIYPSSVTVTFDCVFPLQDNPENSISLYVDYKEFSSSVSGKCLIHVEGGCEGLIKCSIDPQTCDCFEIVN